MKYTQLGNSDLNVSRICLGCMGFGEAGNGMHSWTLGYEDSKAIIRRSLELGVNFFDTALAYQNGTSEQFVGRALRELASRNEVVIATKFMPRRPNELGELSAREHIENCVNRSLQNLGTDYIDLYIMHMWDYHSDLAEEMTALNDTVKAGKVRHIGIANAFAWQVGEANALAQREGLAKFVSVQNHHNLIYREDERELTDFALVKNIALTPYSALAGGRLARPVGTVTQRSEEDQFAKFKYDSTASQDQIIIGRVAELAEKYGVSMTEISIAWLLTKTASPIAGATKFHHVEQAAKAVDLTLSPDDRSYLEEAYVPHKLSGIMAQNTPTNHPVY